MKTIPALFCVVSCLFFMDACADSGAGIHLNARPAQSFSDTYLTDSFYIASHGTPTFKYAGSWISGDMVREYFYNYSGSTLDYIDYRLRKHVQLFAVGEKLANGMEGIGLLSPDTLVFLLNDGIALYLPEGKVLKKYAFTENEKKRARWQGDFSPLLITPFGYVYSRVRNINKSVLGLYSVAEKKVSPIPIGFPRLAKGNAGLSGEYSHIYFKGKVAVLFNLSPNLYVYDLKTETTKTYSIRSDYDTGFVPFMDGDIRDVKNHFITQGNYFSMTYDPYRDEILAVYLHPQALKNDSGYYNDPFLTRTASLLVLDSRLQNKREYVFAPTRCWLYYRPYPTPEGIVLKGIQTKEDFGKYGMKYYLANFR